MGVSIWVTRMDTVHDMEMEDLKRAETLKEELRLTNQQINASLPHIKELIDSLEHTKGVFVDLYNRLSSEKTEDENWI